MHISFFENRDADLLYAYRSVEGSWSVTTLDHRGDVGARSVIDVSMSGNTRRVACEFFGGETPRDDEEEAHIKYLEF